MARERLSPLDASFLYLDGPVTCNQAVALNIVEGEIDFPRLREEMQRKLRDYTRLRQCVVFSPLNLFRPTWELDPRFDIDNHVILHRIESPYSEAIFREKVEEIFLRKFDRSHPLWAVHVIQGLPDGRSAQLTVIHHSLSDGVGFAKLASAFFDIEPAPRLDEWKPEHVPALPSGWRRLWDGTVDAVMSWVPSEKWRLLQTLKMYRQVFSGRAREARAQLKRFRRAPAIRFPFNTPLSGTASYTQTKCSMEEIARIRSRRGGTVNDVLLTLVTSAVARYATNAGIPADETYLRILVPSNVRSDENRNEMGNFVSMAPVIAPLGNMPAAERLAEIQAYTAEMKACGLAQLTSMTIGLSQSMLPPALSKHLHGLFVSRWMQRVTNKPTTPPPFNIVVTNVPGAPVSTFVAGKRITDVSVLVPLLPSIGLVCGALSHDGMLYVTFTADRALLPDVELLSGYVDETIAELLNIGN